MRQVWDSKLDRGKCNRPNEVRLFIRRLNNSCWIWLTPQKDIIEWMILSDRFCSLIVRQGRAHAVKRMKHFLFQLSFNHTSENLYFTKTILPLPKKSPKLNQTPHKTPDKQVVGFRLCYFIIHPNLLIVPSPNRQHKRNLHICMGSPARKRTISCRHERNWEVSNFTAFALQYLLQHFRSYQSCCSAPFSWNCKS